MGKENGSIMIINLDKIKNFGVTKTLNNIVSCLGE